MPDIPNILNTPSSHFVTVSPDLSVKENGEPMALHNRTFDELQMGDSASITHTLTREDVTLFALATGDLNPQHIDDAYAANSIFKTVIAHGMWGAGQISAVLGMRFPGPGTIYLGQTLHFRAPVLVGDTITTTLTVSARDEVKRHVTFSCECTNQHGKTVISGDATVIPPREHVEWVPHGIPEVRLIPAQDGARRLVDYALTLGRIRTAIVHPCNALTLDSALKAAARGLIEPVFIAPKSRLEALAEQCGYDLSGIAIEDVPHSDAPAEPAAETTRAGTVEATMKGSLHTDELMAAVVAKDSGLRTKRRITHCFLLQSPAYPRPFIITDAAINILPTLEVKADIIRNAIDLAHAIGVARPKVAILAAVETVNPAMPATLDAAALCKMADRGQITSGVLDGPLALDNAVSAHAAAIKGIQSEVAGEADILVVPDLESGNMMAKQLEYLGGAHMAGIVLGAKLPIILTSRADEEESRIASCALAVVLAHHYRVTPP